jgi:HEPN domain-containing protein
MPHIEKSEGYRKGFYARYSDLSNMDISKMRSFYVYCAGVCVECWLRSVIMKHSSEFDEKHDLRKMLSKAIAFEDDLKQHKRELSALIDKISRYWYNGMRYKAEYDYAAFLVSNLKGVYSQSPSNVVARALPDFKKTINEFYKIGVKIWT